MKHYIFLLRFSGLLSLCVAKIIYSIRPHKSVEVMTFNIRLDAPSDSANNWKYRKQMLSNDYLLSSRILGMQEVCHNQMEDLKQGLPQCTALGGRTRRWKRSR